MPLEQDVLDIGKQLEKLVGDGNPDNETASDLLSRLKELPITLDILQKTRIGMAVNVVRKATTKDDIQTLAKGLIKSWKKLLDSQEKNKKEKSDTSNLNKSIPPSAPKSDNNSTSTPSTRSGSKSFPPSPPSKLSDPTRRRCQEMIASSLKCEQRPDFDPTNVAAHIESAIYDLFCDTGPKYKNRIKSRVLNLRDKRNVQLRISIIDGEISADKFANMTAEELACDDLKQERKNITEQAIKDHQLSKNTGTSTGQFKCFKCGLRDTSYSQLQTRSADEPMTTFVYCNKCGNRWKFC